jgi:peroxiredoxin
MLQAGDRIPEVSLWLRPREPVTLAELVEAGPVLLLFYLFDWSST